MSKTIAIVEDEPAIRDNYAELFRRHGYAVETFENRPDAWSAMQQQLPDLAILDIGLQDEIDGGFDLCRDLRSLSATLPIIFLTARDSDFDTVAGLRLGADDYVTKDVSLPQLSARVAALLRRANAIAQPDTQAEKCIEIGSLLMNLDTLHASWKSISLELTLTEFWILHALIKHPGHVKTRDQLMEAANTYVDGGTITSHIKRIRRKFEQLDNGFSQIESVYGAGYRWIPTN